MKLINDAPLISAPPPFRAIDRRFADHICRLARDSGNRPLWLAAALASQAVGEGHVCLDLHAAITRDDAVAAGITDTAAWAGHLKSTSVVGEPGAFTPLVLDSCHRLYLHRYWSYEKNLATVLLRLASDQPAMDDEQLQEGITRLFPATSADVFDWQRLAAQTCVSRRFAVIAGGPGTGKTSTVLRVLVLLIEQASRKCHIALAAPTGKAAARLRESVLQGRDRIVCHQEIREQIPDDAVTIHRLLGYKPGSSQFRHNKDNPLPYDVIVVDEASMVSLPLMAKLTDALGEHARLIMLGDRDQLASVEAGAVLGDICNTGDDGGHSPGLHADDGAMVPGLAPASAEALHPLRESIAVLRTSYRYAAESGIGELGRLVNKGDGTAALALLQEGKPDLTFNNPPLDKLEETIAVTIADGFSPYLLQHAGQQSLLKLSNFRILCALRLGPYGTIAINGLVEKILERKGLITPRGRWYAGQPVMVIKNDHRLRLYNGDIGIILPDPAAGNELRAFFTATDGSLRAMLPLRLPEHETAFAMTVHKSQGSEFERTLLILPDRHSDVLTRELVYTALSRARKHLEICGPQDVLARAIERRSVRNSGLREALWGAE